MQNGLYPGFAAGWLADYPDPQDWLTLQFHTGAPDNFAKLSNTDLDHLMDQADVNTDQNARMQQYNTAEQDVVNLSPWIPYAQGKWFWLQRSWVHGFGLNALEIMPDINWPSVYIADHTAG